jgi:hypothetical protein
MISELFTWLTTRCAPQARQLGYLYEAIAMRERVKRCELSWRSHLTQARQFAQTCIEQQAPGGIALVLGSGLGLDIPQAVLLSQFDEVWLVDMVHLRSTRKAWQGSAKVRFIEADVTEVLASVTRGELPASHPQRWLDNADIRFVLSANILGQLPVQPLAWLTKHYPHKPESELDAWSQQLLQGHLDYLSAFAQQGAGVCLIADMEWHYAESNQVREVVDAWRGLDQPLPDARWEWRIAPRGEMGLNRTQTNWVGGWCWRG